MPDELRLEEDRRRSCLDKLTWRSENEALAARAYAQWQHGPSPYKAAPYKCSFCSKWHLTRLFDQD